MSETMPTDRELYTRDEARTELLEQARWAGRHFGRAGFTLADLRARLAYDGVEHPDALLAVAEACELIELRWNPDARSAGNQYLALFCGEVVA